MARKAAKRLTPKGVLALKKEGYYADSEAVGLYVQVAYRQKGTHEKGGGSQSSTASTASADHGSTGSPRPSPSACAGWA